jgi:hypothetical protein
MMEAIRSSETLILTRATRRHMPEDGILHVRYFSRQCEVVFLLERGPRIAMLFLFANKIVVVNKASVHH